MTLATNPFLRLLCLLLMLRDPKLCEMGEEGLIELATKIKDPNYRVFAEGGQLHCINNAGRVTAVANGIPLLI